MCITSAIQFPCAGSPLSVSATLSCRLCTCLTPPAPRSAHSSSPLILPWFLSLVATRVTPSEGKKKKQQQPVNMQAYVSTQMLLDCHCFTSSWVQCAVSLSPHVSLMSTGEQGWAELLFSSPLTSWKKALGHSAYVFL